MPNWACGYVEATGRRAGLLAFADRFLAEDNEDKGNEVSGHELFRLTQKAKVLLTCCILDLLGLTHKEIDLCFEKSVFKSVIASFY